MQCQQAGRGIEGALRGIVDITLLQLNTGVERPERALGLLQHRGGGIDADEMPARPRLRQGFQLQSAAGAEHQHLRVGRSPLRQQNAGHAVRQTGTTGPNHF